MVELRTLVRLLPSQLDLAELVAQVALERAAADPGGLYDRSDGALTYDRRRLGPAALSAALRGRRRGPRRA